MTMRERMLAVVQGREHDRVPFVQYSDNSAPDDEIWAEIGRENMGILRWTVLHYAESPNCRFKSEPIARDGRNGYRQTLITPEGELYEERYLEPTFGTAAASSFYVKEPGDYRVLMAYFRDLCVHKVLEGFRDSLEELGEDGLPHTSLLRTPFQQLWIEWVSIENLAVHLAECPDLMAEVFDVMTDVQHRVFETVCAAVCEAPVPYLVFGDNITAPVIGTPYFQQYCVPAYNELAEMLDETGKDIPIFVHMDGDLRPLWDAISASRVRGLDSMSPPPDNDTSVSEAMSRWPEMRVCLNFPSSVHLQPPDTIYDAAVDILEQGGRAGRLQIQVSENVPPGVWRTSYPQIVRAINDFGPACS